MQIIFRDESFSFELLRAIGYAAYGGADIGADIGECLLTAYRITEGDGESWYREWRATADRVHDIAEACQREGRLVSAREAFLRASNYYRVAEFFLRADPAHDPRVRETSTLNAHCFAQAGTLSSPAFEQVRIPYEGTTLPGYLFTVDESGAPRPTLLFMGGFDSTVEELYFAGGAAALRRGYNCLAVDGPGQGSVIREQGLPYRHDWEHIVTPIIDWALTRPEIDGARIALMGMSMGGYLAPRAAAFEHRVAALVCYDGVYDNLLPLLNAMPPFLREWASAGRDADVDAVLWLLAAHNTKLRWSLQNGCWTFAVPTPSALLRADAAYTMRGLAAQVRCPTLVCDAENDLFFKGQATQFHDELTCPKAYRLFTAAEGAEEHCQEGALLRFHQVAFDWLDGVLGVGAEAGARVASAA